MPDLEYFTVTSAGIGSIGVDYVDAGVEPDEDVVYAFVDFVPREEAGTVHWLSGLDVPRGIQLDPVRGRYSSEDGQLRTIVGHPTNEKQLVTAAGTPITLTYSGQTTAPFADTVGPAAVQAALEALSNLAVGDVYVSGQIHNEKQTVTVAGGATGGTFTLTFNGQTTIPIVRNASSSTIQSALQALSTVGGEGVSVTGNVGGPWIVEFTGNLAGVDVPLITSAPRSEVQTITVNGLGGAFQLTYSGQTTADIAYNATPATVQAALEALSNIGVGDVVVSAADPFGYVVTFAGALANKNVPLITPVPARNEKQVVTLGGTHTGGTFSLTFAGQTASGIPYNATASVVRTMLENACNNIAPGDIAVDGNAGGPWTVTFQGVYAQINVPQMTAVSAITPSGTVTVTTLQEGLGVDGDEPTVAVTVEAVFLTPSGTVSVVATVTGTAGTPWTVNFVGTLQGTDVPQMTATNATVSTLTGGSSVLGVELVANTPVLDLGLDKDGDPVDLIYDVVITVPDLDPLKQDRVIAPFAIVAPRVGGAVVDLADADLHIPPKRV